MNDEIKQKTQEQIDKLEKEKLKEMMVYTIDFGMYKKFSTTDKDLAFKIWSLMASDFFSLDQAGMDKYEPPYFKYKTAVNVKLSASKEKVWVDQESAQRAHNAFMALSPNKSNKI
jgi:hypothetical protein